MHKEKKKIITPWIWGFTTSAENWNGRFAMTGFAITLLVEFVTGKGVVHFLGIL
jgi:hypothetical protein